MTFPPFDTAIEAALLKELGTDGAPHPRAWAASVQRLSDHYVANPDSISPWNQAWAREALLCYFHPLNQARGHRAGVKGHELGFFKGLRHMVDLGCGSAAASLGLLSAAPKGTFQTIDLVDHAPEVVSVAKRIVGSLHPGTQAQTGSLETFHKSNLNSVVDLQATLLVLSYVLTEAHSADTLKKLIHRLPNLEALAILEPSTSEDARRLQALRPVLMELGFHLWAPCTHHAECPLLKDSDRDWCHDRLVPARPSWWNELEAELPMKNRTVTVSYLLARRTPRPDHPPEVRVIGDQLDEKTKIRQMICRADAHGSNREFISWFPSRLKKEDPEIKHFELQRGDLFLADDQLWKDPRGQDRSREWRLDLDGIRIIQTTLKSHR